jgi:hypothetical protein
MNPETKHTEPSEHKLCYFRSDEGITVVDPRGGRERWFAPYLCCSYIPDVTWRDDWLDASELVNGYSVGCGG